MPTFKVTNRFAGWQLTFNGTVGESLEQLLVNKSLASFKCPSRGPISPSRPKRAAERRGDTSTTRLLNSSEASSNTDFIAERILPPKCVFVCKFPYTAQEAESLFVIA